ncbi:PEP-CTERM sorting domain-containing protein [Nostocales cyanobacterium LEGE 11386]|nr:PEP-CTERM sorting domain-containing protein [Nostocales cyanobacterium LEGE 11386]
MPKIFSKLVFGLSITSAIGLYCFALAPSALAKNPNKNSTPTSTTSNTTTTSSSVKCSLTDVFIGSVSASACQGPFSGNDTGAGNPLLTELNNGLFNVGTNVTWELVGKSDSSQNNQFGFQAQNDSSTGTWSLDQALDSGPSTFVISLKSSTSYSAYLFQNINLSQTGLEGIFNTIGVSLAGNGKSGKDLSHASLFKASYVTIPETPQRTPEPATIAALGFCVVGALRVLKKKPLVQA